MKYQIINFSNDFVKEVGELVKKQKESGLRAGLTKDEVFSVISETFYLLGREHNKIKNKAKIK